MTAPGPGSAHVRRSTPEVAVIGGGPAGLTAARRLCELGREVVVIDREDEAGGIPRHSDHTGYGVRDLRRVLSGPAYARRLVRQAEDAGATILTQAMATGWGSPNTIQVTAPSGRTDITPQALVLATGARERPRPARLIPGDRPQGVLTTGHLQNLVHLHHAPVGERAVVVGAELVSWSAVMSLRHAGCTTVEMLTVHRRPEAYRAFTLPGRTVLGVRVATRTRLVRIIGKPRVTAVEVEDLDTGSRRTIACDTVILTGDWIPDHELARGAGLDLDPVSLGPVVDTALRTSRPGIFAAGNLLHPVDTADVAALDGSHVADQVDRWLATPPELRSELEDGVDLVVDAPLRWIAPSRVRPGDPAPPRGRLLLWTDEYIAMPTVVLRQGGRVLSRRRLPWPAAPGRAFRVPWSMAATAERTGGEVRVSVE